MVNGAEKFNNFKKGKFYSRSKSLFWGGFAILPDMFAEVHYPGYLKPEELDRYLEQGWFRMGQTIFTTNFLHFKQQYYSAIWLRVGLRNYKRDKLQDKLAKRNAGFKAIIRHADLSVEKEELFAKYKQAISFDTSPSLYHLLYGKSFHNIYDTLEVNLFDGERLIGAGFFDVGASSAAGITSFYDPAYKKYSLGKYLIYLKMQYCRDKGFEFFYPGYFVPGYNFFNYKLELGRETLEFLDVSRGDWRSIQLFTVSAFQMMQDKLFHVQQLLDELSIPNRLFKYEFFDANLFPELKDARLFDYPLFLYCFAFHDEAVNPMVIFDVRSGTFKLVQCRSIWASHLPESGPDIYSYHLLKQDEEIHVSDDAYEIVSRIKAMNPG